MAEFRFVCWENVHPPKRTYGNAHLTKGNRIPRSWIIITTMVHIRPPLLAPCHSHTPANADDGSQLLCQEHNRVVCLSLLSWSLACIACFCCFSSWCCWFLSLPALFCHYTTYIHCVVDCNPRRPANSRTDRKTAFDFRDTSTVDFPVQLQRGIHHTFRPQDDILETVVAYMYHLLTKLPLQQNIY